MPVPLKPARKSSGGVTRNAAGERQFYLTRRRFSVNCIFLYGHRTTIRSVRSRARPRLSATRGGLFLRSVPARLFRGAVAARHRSAPGRPCEVAPRVRARSAVARYFCAYGGLPASRAGHLRYSSRFRHSPTARAVNSPVSVQTRGRISELILRRIPPCVGAGFPVPSFRSKIVRQPNRNASVLTGFGGQVSQNEGDSSD